MSYSLINSFRLEFLKIQEIALSMASYVFKVVLEVTKLAEILNIFEEELLHFSHVGLFELRNFCFSVIGLL